MNELKEKEQTQDLQDLTSRQKIDLLLQVVKNAYQKTMANDKSEIEMGCRYEHEFYPGLYVRKMFIPKGLVIVTKVHKTKHPYFIMKGDVIVHKDGETVRLVAPFQGTTDVGTRRALMTLEDTVWITIHVTDKTDLVEICKDLASDTIEEFDEWQKSIGSNNEPKSIEEKEGEK